MESIVNNLTNYIIYLLFGMLLLSDNGWAAQQKAESDNSQQVIKILSLDGGGVRGVIPAVLVKEIEKQTGKPITESFDLFVGTSTGGLIALFVNVSQGSKQRYSGENVIQMYKDLSRKIFQNPTKRKIRTLGGLIGSKYSAKPLEVLLQQYFGDLKMRDTLKPVVVTSFDFKRKEVFLFSSHTAKEWPAMFNLYVRDAAHDCVY